MNNPANMNIMNTRVNMTVNNQMSRQQYPWVYANV